MDASPSPGRLQEAELQRLVALSGHGAGLVVSGRVAS